MPFLGLYKGVTIDKGSSGPPREVHYFVFVLVTWNKLTATFAQISTEGGGQKSVNRKILPFGIFLFHDFGPPAPRRIKHNMPFRQICGNSQWETPIWCSHNLCGNNCSHKFVGTANRDPISCSHNPCGNSAVPTKLVGNTIRFLLSGTGK